jgi:hypothetical protein
MTEYRLMEMCDYLTYSDIVNKYGNADPLYNQPKINHLYVKL